MPVEQNQDLTAQKTEEKIPGSEGELLRDLWANPRVNLFTPNRGAMDSGRIQGQWGEDGAIANRMV